MLSLLVMEDWILVLLVGPHYWYQNYGILLISLLGWNHYTSGKTKPPWPGCYGDFTIFHQPAIGAAAASSMRSTKYEEARKRQELWNKPFSEGIIRPVLKSSMGLGSIVTFKVPHCVCGEVLEIANQSWLSRKQLQFTLLDGRPMLLQLIIVRTCKKFPLHEAATISIQCIIGQCRVP